MKRIISIILIFCHVTLLFAQYPPPPSSKFREIIYFKPGGGISISKSNVEITGELISIKLKQKLNPETGFTSEVVFKPFEKSLISPSVVGGTLNNGEYYIFDVNDILKIESRYLVGGYKLKTLFSDKVQNDYSNREEINDMLNKTYIEFHQTRQQKNEDEPKKDRKALFDFVGSSGGLRSADIYERVEYIDQEIEIKKWGKFSGRLYSISLNKKLNPDTGLKSEIVFKVFETTKSLPDSDPFLVKGTKFVEKSEYGPNHFATLMRIADSGNAYIFDAKDVQSIKQGFNPFYYNHDLILYNQDFQNEYKNRQDVLDILSHEVDVFDYQLDRKNTSGIFLNGFCVFILFVPDGFSASVT